MAYPFLGEIRMNGYVFTPAGWQACDGSLLSINENTALFQLLGTTYGGDGQNTFGVPDLRGAVPLHQGTDSSGNTYSLGQKGGAATVTLNTNQLGTHNHSFQGSNSDASQPGPSGSYPASGLTNFYSTDTNSANFVSLSPNSTSTTGGSQPHNNLMPYLCINFIIAVEGQYPSQA